MTRKEKAAYIMEELERLYPKPALPLDYHSPFTLLIAVLLAARNTDVGVNKVTPQLFKKADTPKAMVKLTVDEIQDLIRSIFMSARKSKAIHELSEILIRQYDGKVPQDIETLETLPGVGHKTASVVAGIAFDVPAFPVDTHIQRMMMRWGLTSGKNVQQIEEDGKKIFPREKWNKLYLQITLYGRERSPARGARLSEDPITAKVGNKKVLSEFKE